MARVIANESAARRMLEAYDFFKRFPEVKKMLDGQEHKIGLIQFDYGKYVIHLGWLKNVGMAWTFWDCDMSCPIPLKRARPQNVKHRSLSPQKASHVMGLTEVLANRGHPIAHNVLCKKEEKARFMAKKVGFVSEELSEIVGGVWSVSFHLSSRRAFVFVTVGGSVYVGVAPGDIYYIRQGQFHALTLFDVYSAIVRRGKRNALKLVADTPEKKAKLLMQILAHEGRRG